MTRQKSILYLLAVLALAVLAMNMPWVSTMFESETGAGVGATPVLIPFVIVCVLSIIGLIQNKIINIIVDILSIIISVLLTLFFGYFYMEMTNDLNGVSLADFGIGFKLIVMLAVGAIVISIKSLSASIRFDKATANIVGINGSSVSGVQVVNGPSCKKCGHGLIVGQRFCTNCACEVTEDTKQIINNENNFNEGCKDNTRENINLNEVSIDSDMLEPVNNENNQETVSCETEKLNMYKQEENEASKFCTGCGAKLNAGQQFCISCGTKVATESLGNSNSNNIGLENKTKEDNTVNKTKEVNDVNSTKINTYKKPDPRKRALAIGGVIVLVVGIAGMTAFNKYKSENVSKKVIKNDLIGTVAKIGNMEVKVTEDNLKSVDLNEKSIVNELGIKFYNNDGIIVIEEAGYSAELPFEIDYLSKGKTWSLESKKINISSDKVVLKINEDMEEEAIKDILVSEEIRGVKITKEIASNLKITSMDKSNQDTIIKVKATLSDDDRNKTKLKDLYADIYFNGTKWVVSNTGGTLDRNSVNNDKDTSTSSNASTSNLTGKFKDEYIIPTSSTVKLTFTELNGYTIEELNGARNEILARHGYSFNNKPNLKKHFQSKSWYKENLGFNGEVTSDIEKYNIGQIEATEFIKIAYKKSSEIKSDYVLKDSKTILESSSSIAALTDWELIIARNEVYARYGLNFSIAELKNHFGSKSWFKIDDSVGNNLALTDIENKNVALILDEEKKRMKIALDKDL